jgi:benzoate-CoA ligase
MQASQRRPLGQPAPVEIPRDYNAAHDLLQRNAHAPARSPSSMRLSGEQLTYGQLAEQSHRFANALRAQGFAPESRVLLAMLDTPNGRSCSSAASWPAWCPVAANTLLTKDFDFMLRDSRAQGLFVSKPCCPPSSRCSERSTRSDRVVAGDRGRTPVAACCASGSADQQVAAPAPTTPASGCIPAAPPARPRARCTCTATWCRRPNSMAAACWASARTTSCIPPPSCSSPTAWATRSPSP